MKTKVFYALMAILLILGMSCSEGKDGENGGEKEGNTAVEDSGANEQEENPEPADNGTTITFNMSSADYPPFLILEDEDNPRGIMYDVLKVIADKHGYNLKPYRAARKRLNQYLEDGTIDGIAQAKDWEAEPDKYVWSEPVVKFKDVIFYKKGSDASYEKPEDLKGKKLGTHIGYSYPPFEELFKSGEVERVDANTETAMLKMVDSGRTAGAIVNDKVGLWLIKTGAVEDNFEHTEANFGLVDYRFMFRKDMADFIDVVNAELEKMKESGELEKIFQKYQ